MVGLHASLNGSVNVYTMDPRGSGRSTRLDCASLHTTQSSSGDVMDPSWVPSCAKELHMKYGDLASFSTTSVAMDIATFISEYANGTSTIVYGVSYGTMVVERLMHSNPSNVPGYVLDSIVTSSGAQADKADIIDFDTDTGEVGEHFMDLCEQDKDCDAHFKATSFPASLRNTYSSFDIGHNSTCAALILNGQRTNHPMLFGIRWAAAYWGTAHYDF